MTILEVSEDSIQKPTETKPQNPLHKQKKTASPKKNSPPYLGVFSWGWETFPTLPRSPRRVTALLWKWMSPCVRRGNPNCRSRQRRGWTPGDEDSPFPWNFFFWKKPQTVGRVTGPQKGFTNAKLPGGSFFGRRVFDYIILWCVLRGWQGGAWMFHLLMSCGVSSAGKSCLFWPERTRSALDDPWNSDSFFVFCFRKWNAFSRCWFQILFNFHPELCGRFPFWLILGACYKDVLFSPRKLGRWSNLTNIFQMGWFNHHLVGPWSLDFFLVLTAGTPQRFKIPAVDEGFLWGLLQAT